MLLWSVAQIKARSHNPQLQVERNKLTNKLFTNKQTIIYYVCIDIQNITLIKGVVNMGERFIITQEESEKVLKTYFKNGLDGGIDSIPSKEKKKIIILQLIIKRFELGKTYSEKEVNTILKTVNVDYVSLRRYLIEYGFMDRTDDGSSYWVKE